MREVSGLDQLADQRERAERTAGVPAAESRCASAAPRRRKRQSAALFGDAGFAVIDLGGLPTGGELQQIHHLLAGVNLIRIEE